MKKIEMIPCEYIGIVVQCIATHGAPAQCTALWHYVLSKCEIQYCNNIDLTRKLLRINHAK